MFVPNFSSTAAGLWWWQPSKHRTCTTRASGSLCCQPDTGDRGRFPAIVVTTWTSTCRSLSWNSYVILYITQTLKRQPYHHIELLWTIYYTHTHIPYYTVPLQLPKKSKLQTHLCRAASARSGFSTLGVALRGAIFSRNFGVNSTGSTGSTDDMWCHDVFFSLKLLNFPLWKMLLIEKNCLGWCMMN